MSTPNDLYMDYHGDDYAASVHNSARMLELIEAGKLDSMSIFPNMGRYDECMKMLHEKWDSLPKKPKLAIHLNIIDGYSLSGCGNPDLCNDKGIMCANWGQLFMISWLGGKRRNTVRNDIRLEFKGQIKRVYEDLPEGASLRLDSHVHTHMIPMVSDALIDALSDLDLTNKTEYIRVSDEPLAPHLTTKGIASTLSFVNIIKNRILHILSGRLRRKLDALGIAYAPVWGLCMTGHMDKDRIEKTAPKMKDAAVKKSSSLEIMCHPGIVLESEDSPEYGPDDRRAFFSPDRNTEYDGVLNRSV